MSDYRDEHPICPLTHHNDPDRPRRTTPGARICHGHYQRLGDDLAALPALHAELSAHLHATGSGPGRGDGDDGLNLNTAVLDARHHIRNSLVTWVRIVLEEGPGDHAPDDDLPTIAAWLNARLSWLANQDWTPALCREWRDNVAEARSLIQPNSVYRVELGPCP